MADTRCVSKSVYRRSAFLDMPLSTQGLYTQLMLEADNRGYVQGARNLIRYFGTNIDELKLLALKNFIIFRDKECDLILITHFRLNNTIKVDRFKETLFIEDFKNIYLNENGEYTLENTGIKAIEQPINNSGKYISKSIGFQVGTSLEPQNKIKEKKIKETKSNQNKLNDINTGNIAYLGSNTSNNNASDTYSDSEEVEKRKRLVAEQAEALKDINYGN